MQVDSLASGSSGNAYLVRSGETTVLVEAGMPASKLAKFLAAFRVDPRMLDGVLLTHAHSDHLQGARELSDRYGVPVYATNGTLGHRTLRDSPLARSVEAGRTLEIGELEILPFGVPHDCREPVGFRVRGPEATVCVTTDLGFVPDEVPALLDDSDLLILEANHDEQLLWHGPYPSHLKRRVSGTHGHLSNEAAARCVASLQRRPPGEIWLAHLSLVNNRVATALEVVRRGLDGAGLAHVALAAAGRNKPSLRWRSTATERQLALF